ncbi:MAG: tetratricopeptide repeat protein [Phycisphaerales bacterium]
MLLVGSCELATGPDVAVGPAASPDESRQVLAYSAPGSAQRSAAAVTTTPGQTNYKRARFAAAVSGLRFDTGVVEVEPFDEYDADFAWTHLEEATELLEAGRALKAIGAYRDSIRWAPDLADAYNGLGITLRLENKISEALAALRTALQLDPAFVEARFNLAITLWMNGEPAEATHQMQQVVRQQPDHALAHERLAIWSYYAGEAQAAWRHVRAAQALDHALPPQFLALLGSRMPDRSR